MTRSRSSTRRRPRRVPMPAEPPLQPPLPLDAGDRDVAQRPGEESDGSRAVASSAPRPTPEDIDGPLVEVQRSARRRRTVSAYREGGRTIVQIPARMSVQDERRWVSIMLERLAAKEQRRQFSGQDLLARAGLLSARYLGGRAQPRSVRWVENQERRWGSCTAADGSIRLSGRLQGMPARVVDYVLLHELAHLLIPSHAPQFWTLLETYPHTDWARGYLEGWAAAAEQSMSDEADT